MVIYENMINDERWYNANLHLEDRVLYANLTGTEWVVLARNVDSYSIDDMELEVIISPTPLENYGFTLFSFIDQFVMVKLFTEDRSSIDAWTMTYAEYIRAKENYLDAERKVVERLNAQMRG